MAMKEGLIGRKVGMTQVFGDDGNMIPVTVVQLGPCTVVSVRTKATHGYDALQLGFEAKKKNVTKPMAGVYKKAGLPGPLTMLREMRMQKTEAVAPYTVGQTLTADIFSPGEFVDVVGVTKGKGFQGGVKRHGWSGGDATHGSMFHRAPGLHRRLVRPLPRVARPSAARAHGRGPPDRPQPAGGARAPRAEPHPAAGRGTRRPGRLRDGAEEREADQGAAAEGAGGKVACRAFPFSTRRASPPAPSSSPPRSSAVRSGCRCSIRRWCASWPTGARARTRPSGAARCAGAAASPGARRVPGARVRAPSAPPSGRAAAGRSDRARGSTTRSLPTEMRRVALRSALAGKVAASELAVVERMTLGDVKTKTLVASLKGLGAAGVPTLLVLAERSADVERAARNIPWLQVTTAGPHLGVPAGPSRARRSWSGRRWSPCRRRSGNERPPLRAVPAAHDREEHAAEGRAEQRDVRGGEGRQQGRDPPGGGAGLQRQGGRRAHRPPSRASGSGWAASRASAPTGRRPS